VEFSSEQNINWISDEHEILGKGFCKASVLSFNSHYVVPFIALG